jgi:cell division septal protein FtsQ
VALVSDGGIFALGQNGEVKTCGPDCTPEKFPIVTGLKVLEVPGTMGVMLKTTVDMAVLHAILEASWVDQVSEINVSELPRIVVFTRDAVKIKLNADAQLEQNLRRLASVLKDVHGRGDDIVTVDARYKDQIVVKPRSRR